MKVIKVSKVVVSILSILLGLYEILINFIHGFMDGYTDMLTTVEAASVPDHQFQNVQQAFQASLGSPSHLKEFLIILLLICGITGLVRKNKKSIEIYIAGGFNLFISISSFYIIVIESSAIYYLILAIFTLIFGIILISGNLWNENVHYNTDNNN